MSVQKQQAYEDLLANPFVKNALNPFWQSDEADLLQFVWDLECNATQDWEEYDDHAGGMPYEIVRKIWLRRNAVILYNEVNQIYPWSIVPELVDGSYAFYTPDMLKHLMGWDEGENAQDGPVWSEPKPGRFSTILYQPDSDSYLFSGSRNPATAMHLAHEIFAKYSPSGPLEALYSIVDEMWAMGWQHEAPGNSADYFGIGGGVDLQTRWALKRTGCHGVSSTIQEVLSAMGVPAAKASFDAHSGLWIEFASGVKVLPSGDDFFAVGKFVATPDIFFTPEQLAKWAESSKAIYWWQTKGTSFECYVAYMIALTHFLTWFSLVDNDEPDEQETEALKELKVEFCNYQQNCLVPESTGCNSKIFNAITKPFKTTIAECFDSDWHAEHGGDAVELEVYIGDDPEFLALLAGVEAYYTDENSCQPT